MVKTYKENENETTPFDNKDAYICSTAQTGL